MNQAHFVAHTILKRAQLIAKREAGQCGATSLSIDQDLALVPFYPLLFPFKQLKHLISIQYQVLLDNFSALGKKNPKR